MNCNAALATWPGSIHKTLFHKIWGLTVDLAVVHGLCTITKVSSLGSHEPSLLCSGVASVVCIVLFCVSCKAFLHPTLITTLQQLIFSSVFPDHSGDIKPFIQV